MAGYKPVSIARSSFAFCRIGMAIMVWVAFALHSVVALVFIGTVFLASALLKVRRAPMIVLCDMTVNRIKKPVEVMVNENAICFAHWAGFVLSTICLVLVCVVSNNAVWYVVLGFAILKTVSATGFCPASQLYDCTINGNCCVNKRKDGSSMC